MFRKMIESGEINHLQDIKYTHPPMTNADRIRAMTDDELVNWIADINPFYCQTCVYAKLCRLEYDVETVNYAEKYDCKDGILQWLQQPADDGTT